jgi:cytochrome c oxidase subunit 3
MALEMVLNAEEVEKQRGAKRMLLWFGIISITMLFAGLTSAYIVRQGEGKWVQFALPDLFKVSTVLIFISSFSMQWAVMAAKRGNRQMLILALGITAVLGFGFVVSQYYSWAELVKQGIYFAGRIQDIKTPFNYIPSIKNETAQAAGDAGNVAGSFLFVITALHVAHLVGGMIAIILVFSRALLGKYSAASYNGVTVCAIYWHFLDGLWIYLYLFLLYIR